MSFSEAVSSVRAISREKTRQVEVTGTSSEDTELSREKQLVSMATDTAGPSGEFLCECG